MPSQSNQYTQKICTYKKSRKTFTKPQNPEVGRCSQNIDFPPPFPTWSSRRSSINFASRFSLSFIVSKTASLGWLSISRGWEEKISCKSGTIFLCFGLLMVCVCHSLPPQLFFPVPRPGGVVIFRVCVSKLFASFLPGCFRWENWFICFFSRGGGGCFL